MSGDGAYVAFATTAALSTADTNGALDVYRKHLSDGAVDMVSAAATGGGAGDGASGLGNISISADGRYVAFESLATNLVLGDTNNANDVFVRDMQGGVTQRVNVNNDGTPPLTTSGAVYASLSSTGRRVAFYSADPLRTNLGVTSPAGVYVRDLGNGVVPGVTIFIGTSASGLGGAQGQVALSGDGNVVAFLDTAPGTLRSFDLTSQTSTVLNPAQGTSAAAGLLGAKALSDDGSAAAFWSDSDALSTGDTNGHRDVFVSTNGSDSIASVLDDGTPGDGDSGPDSASGPGGPSGAISADGRYVVFTTDAPSLHGSAAVLKDRRSGLLVPLSVTPGGASRPAVDASLNADASMLVFSSAAPDLVSDDTNGVSDVFTFTRNTAASAFAVHFQALDPTSPPGAFAIPARNVPAADLPTPSLDTLQDTSIDSIDMSSAPLRSVPLRSVPLRSVPLRSVPLRSVLLSDVRVFGHTWEEILNSLNPNPFVGIPIQSLTLDQVLAADPPLLQSISLADIDFSSTPLRSISMASIALGATPLRSVPVPGTSSNPFDNWCTLLASLGFSCDQLGVTADSPVLALDLAGVPLRSVPLRSVPLRSVDLSSAPLRSVPLRSVFLDGVALGSLALSKLTPPSAVVDCAKVSCTTGTLADAAHAGAFQPGATLGTLFDNVSKDDLPGSLAELFLALVDPANYPWEQLPVTSFDAADHATSPSEVRYELTFSVSGDQAAPATATVTLPARFRFAPGSAAFGSVAIADPSVSGDTLTFSLGSVTGGTTGYALTFRARPDLVLGGPRTGAASVHVGSSQATSSDTAPVTVVDAFEAANAAPNDNSPDTSPILEPDTVYASHIGAPGDVDFFRIPVPPKGTKLVLRLGNQTHGADIDLALYNPVAQPPVRSVPLRSVPLRSVPVPDEGMTTDAETQALQTTLQDDVARLSSVPLRSISANRGDNDERITTVSDAEPGIGRYYTLQVSAYNGGSSDQPYALYVREVAPEVPPVCPAPRTFLHAGEGVAGSAPSLSALPTGLNTLFLVDQKRMGDTYGAAAASSAVSAVQSLAGRSDLGVVGAVWPVESSATVAQALSLWDADPCSSGRANDAFRATADIVDQVRAQRPTLRYVVVVGGDDVVPMARLADSTKLSNESGNTDSLANGTGPQNGTPLTAASAASTILSDDPLGDTDPIAWLDHQLYVPDLSVGRLVESPADVVAQVNQFMAAGGVLDPKTALTTGYDFLADGAQAVDGALPPALTHQTLINDTWTRADELSALFPSSGSSPDIAALNAHYDHHRSLPGIGNTTGDETDLVTTADIAAHPQTLTRRLLFTMGCHAGLNVPDAYMTDPAGQGGSDWAQTLGQNGVAVYFANSGFGYGDTAAVAYSEELMRQFASRLNGALTVGQAAVYAKQAYFGSLGAYGPYDEKVLQESTLYGLPMYRVTGSGVVPPAGTGLATSPDPNGVQSAPLTLTPAFTRQTSPTGGTFYSVNGEVQVVQYRPIEPRTSVDVTPADASLTAHGVLITDLSSSDQQIIPAVARPVVDSSINEPAPPAGDVAFPATLSNLTEFNTPNGQQQRAVFLPGQFFRDATWSASGGVQRLFDRIGSEVKFSTSSDFVAPFITNVTSTFGSGGSLTLRLTALDAGGVARVVVMVKDESGAWRRVELAPESAGSSSYVGTLANVQGTRIEWFAQAMDTAGNVGTSSNKARYYGARSNLVPIVLSPSRPTGLNGWYNGPVVVTIDQQPGVTYTLAIDTPTGAPYTGPVTISADGVHRVEVDGSDGTSGVSIIPLDASAPGLSGSTDRPANANGWFNAPVTVRFSCLDPTSGVASCGPGATVGNEGAGQSVTGGASDYAGNASVPVTVGPLNLDFTPPTLVVSGPADGATYDLGYAPSPSCTASDALSGLDGTCSLTVSGGSSSGAGAWTAVAVARDRAGNVTTKSITWYVRYTFGGFASPIVDTGTTVTSSTAVFKAGSTIPVKFQVFDANGNPTTAAVATWVDPVRGPAVGSAVVNATAPKVTASTGTVYTFDAKTRSYQYNWQTTRAMSGYYWLIGVHLDDGTNHLVYVGIK